LFAAFAPIMRGVKLAIDFGNIRGNSVLRTLIRPIVLILLILAFLTVPTDCDADENACSYFFDRLIEIPHKKLVSSQDGFISIWDGRKTAGCEVVFKSHETLVSGEKVFDLFQSLITAPGWKIDNNLTADGPGSSSVGIENPGDKCAIHWSQHSWVDDKTGKIEQSSDIEITVQCSSR
jgi:hypothetical protein